MSEKSKLISRWRGTFTKGTDFDSWGQLVEAVDEYRMVSRQLHKEAASSTSPFTDDQKKNLSKIATCLELRSRALQSPHSVDGFTLEQLKRVEPVFTTLARQGAYEFPVSVPSTPLRPPPLLESGQINDLDVDDEEDEDDERLAMSASGGSSCEPFTTSTSIKTTTIQSSATSTYRSGNLLPRIPHEPKMTLVTLRVEKLGLKSASSHIDPYITISVKDVSGVDLTPIQETPVAVRKEDLYIHFDADIELQKPLEKLPKGTAIFFEFKHYKPKKKFTSTKCFAFMELDEIKSGGCVIEL
ncbi:axin interactor, dorsalization-associated protein A-like [Saccoglossus kowalevskii]|uniref:Axin interactor, dorsalization-associated protein B-like n=1 Tax=Saccoglossus kowalevskii TaxID=10224 RepID=A0ABM0MY02_SACKO|nr:PREDICTED: axin interactor, dorsalization-associated protein B-like [Saccoglossus kowalevskii]